MDDVAVLADLLEGNRDRIADAIRALRPGEIDRKPDEGANTIGQTVWHCARWFDILGARAFTAGPVDADRELWHVAGWASRTGYDPRGKGWARLGAITGYTPEEMAEIPALSSEEHLRYFEESATALLVRLRATTSEALHTESPLGGGYTRYQALKTVLTGAYGHLGEIEAMVAAFRRSDALQGAR